LVAASSISIIGSAVAPWGVETPISLHIVGVTESNRYIIGKVR
jgi:hypothetical protein